MPRLDLHAMFRYHAPKDDQTDRFQLINDAALAFAKVVQDHTRESAEQTLAIRDIQRARMMANAAVVLGDLAAEREKES